MRVPASPAVVTFTGILNVVALILVAICKPSIDGVVSLPKILIISPVTIL